MWRLLLINIQIKKLTEEAHVPQYQTDEAAGFDLHSVEDYVLKVGERKLIKTGLSMAFPKGYELQIRPRSGLAYKHGITCLNTPGTIDSDYRGEIMVLLINHGGEDFHIKKDERIAQAVLNEIKQATFSVVEELSETDRGAGGFGSTGK
ncbi:MAG: dUTP diphosphatase [Campylobacterales bacterium]|nr:dUTP diphosphatase [Campylobacterales bacterium]